MSGKGDLVTNLILDTQGFDEGAAHARSEAQSLGHDLEHWGREYAGAFFGSFNGFGAERLAEKTMEGVREVFERGYETIRENIEAGAELGHLSKRLGIGTDDLQALQMEARETGVDFELVAGAIKKMDVALGDALQGGEKAKYFKELGVDLEQMANSSQIGRFTALGDAIGSLEDTGSRVHLATELMGRSAAEALNLITKGSQGLEEEKQRLWQFGFFREEDVAQLERVREHLEVLKYAAAGAGRELTSSLAPAIDVVTEFWTKVAQGTNATTQVLPSALDVMAQHEYAQMGPFPIPTPHAAVGMLARYFGYGAHGAQDRQAEAENQHNIELGEAKANAADKYDKEQEKWKEREEEEFISETQRQAEREYREAQRIREHANPRLKYDRETSEIQQLGDSGGLSPDEVGGALADAAKQLKEELDRIDPLRKLKEEAKHLFDNLTHADEFKHHIDELKEMLDKGVISRPDFDRAEKAEADKYRKAEGLEQLDHRHSFEDRHAGAFESGSAEAYSQILKATQPKVDEYARKTAELTQKSVDVEQQISAKLTEIAANLAPAQTVTIPP